MSGVEYELIVVTGASSGLGEKFAEALAGRARRTLLAARRGERLRQLARRLEAEHPGLECASVECDLARESGRERLLAAVAEQPEGACLLINNAGFGDYGDYATARTETVRGLIQVNIQAVAELTHGILPRLLRNGGDIINIASLAADIFLPDFALYAASKAFVASLTEGLRMELRGRGVRVLAVCPGPVHTEFGEVAQRSGFDRGEIPFKSWFYTPAEKVVSSALRALEAGRARCYGSRKVWLSGCLLRMTPLWLERIILGTRPRRVVPQPEGNA